MGTAARDTDGLSPLQRAVLALKEMRSKLDAVERSRREPVAIVGMSCRFPGGGDDPDYFWRLLHGGQSGIVEVPRDRWDIDAFYDPAPATPGKMYTRQGGFLSRVDGFDPGFFGVSAREAASMDPQQRLLLEASWEALENAGQAPRRLVGSSTGVFFGVASNDYAQSIMRRSELSDIDLYFASGTPFNTLAGRVSYILGLQGPTLALDTACSSSLVAVHLACQSLRNGECDMALAGGVNLMLAPETTVIICQNRMLAADGRCKTFDAAADGYVRGEGCGVVVLKRLSDALSGGDEVHAVISGSAVNHDGQSSGFTVPNGPAQQALIRRALQMAGVEPAAVSYVEAHGTGTSLGDPIEMGALGAVFRGPRAAPLLVGSVKTNIGHLEAAAGIAGLIKVVLALEHEEIPPHLNFKQPNPHIAWGDLPVKVPTEPAPWSRSTRIRVAGVSAFGVSGTNAHVVVSEAPAREIKPASVERSSHLLTVSAKTEPALREVAIRYARHLAAHPSLSLADAGYTAAQSRSHFAQRLAVVGHTGAEVLEKLEAFARGERSAGLVHGSVERGRRTEVVFLFTGQGEQYAGMGRHLYETAPVFREALDRCADLLRPHLDRPLLPVIHPVQGEPSPLDETQYTQPALFALEYALAALWRSWGIEPAVVLGHSVGEYVAACVAGVFGLEDGLKLIATRGRLMQSLPRDGEMVAVFAEEERVATAVEHRAAHIAIAAINDPRNVVVSGRSEAVREVVAELESEGFRSRRLTVSHAFHSPLMDPILDEFERVAAGVSFAEPRVPLVSNVTGGLVEGTQVARAGYWRRHLRESVRFAAAMRTLEAEGYRLFLEVGPGTTLLAMGRKCVNIDNGAWVPSLREGRDDWSQLLESLGQLHALGVEVDWAGFDRPYARRRVALPTYPFERHRYWVDTDPPAGLPESGTAPAPSEVVRLLNAGDAERLADQLGAAGAFSGPERQLLPRMVEVLVRKHRERADEHELQEWMHELEWREAPRPETPVAALDGGAWLVFADASGVGRALARRIRERGACCVLVDEGAAFERSDSGLRIDPASAADYGRVLEESTAIAAAQLRGIVHLWALDAGDPSSMTAESLAAAQRVGSGSVLLLLQAMMRAPGMPRPRLWLVTRGSTPAGGDAVKGIAHAPLWGLGRVITLECPDGWGGIVDLASAPPSGGDEAAALMAEILDPRGEDQVALRGARRFVPRVVRSPREAPRSLRFEAEATYMITGGLGGLGNRVADWMAERGARHLVLVGRRGAASAAAREAVERLEKSGVGVRVAKADVADADAMRAAFEEIRTEMATLRGIVHAAGIIDDGILLQQSRERFERVFAPKILGAWNLHRLTRGMDLDHLVLFSSTASVLGEGGQGNYSAANAFLDALAHHRRALGLPALSINWGPWSGVGIATEHVLERVARRGIAAIPPERGVRALEAVLGRQVGQIAIVAADWRRFFEHVPASVDAPVLRELARGHAALAKNGRETKRKGAPRPNLQNDFVAPGNETEERLAELWAEELGIDQVGINDNLFELGGDSLISIQIVNRVRTIWRKDVSTIALYEAPTVGSFAKILADDAADRSALDDSDLRAQRRRSRVATRKP